ncbi:hypothetical protein EEB14_07370 [Rhodococcus sp. WS4]|nr:hypothetical protein EEB14_07370 [Rhodococcus sp. WS4]
MYVSNISDNPESWEPHEWVEPGRGLQAIGKFFALQSTGSTGTLMCGLWRTGGGIAGCEPDGSSTVSYTAPIGDEATLLLEGRSTL